MCVPGVLAPLHRTVSSPVLGLDSRLRSVGGDRAGDKEEKQESDEDERNKRKDRKGRGIGGRKKTANKRKIEKYKVKNYWFVLTCDNTACDWGSVLLAVYDWLDAVGVLHSRSQTGNINTSRVRGHVSGGFSALTGTHCQLKDRCRQSQRNSRERDMEVQEAKVRGQCFPKNMEASRTFSSLA